MTKDEFLKDICDGLYIDSDNPVMVRYMENDEAIDILQKLKDDGLISEYSKRRAKSSLQYAKWIVVSERKDYNAYISKEIYEEDLIVDSANSDYSSQYDF